MVPLSNQLSEQLSKDTSQKACHTVPGRTQKRMRMGRQVQPGMQDMVQQEPDTRHLQANNDQKAYGQQVLAFKRSKC
jgi:hypothetical protein